MQSTHLCFSCLGPVWAPNPRRLAVRRSLSFRVHDFKQRVRHQASVCRI